MIFIDLGFPRVDEFLKAYPKRAFTTGASEQTALDIAVGLALAGKAPVTYTITPFYYRAWETVRTYINKEQLNVKMVGVGRDEEYGVHDGFSHSATDFKSFMDLLPNIHQSWPNSTDALVADVEDMMKSYQPEFLSLRR